jgi:transposase
MRHHQGLRHDPTVQRAYAECAEGYGFKIDPCPPYDPQKKGIVESGVKYVKGNFLPCAASATWPT